MNYQVLIDVSSLFIEVYPYFHQATTIQTVGDEVAFFINLLQSLFSTAIQLEFKHIDGILSLHHGIGTATGTTNLALENCPISVKMMWKMT